MRSVIRLKETKEDKKPSWYCQTRATRLEVSQGHQTYHRLRGMAALL